VVVALEKLTITDSDVLKKQTINTYLGKKASK
jgi:hypothetical protein